MHERKFLFCPTLYCRWLPGRHCELEDENKIIGRIREDELLEEEEIPDEKNGEKNEMSTLSYRK
jgi:hypothetical protein